MSLRRWIPDALRPAPGAVSPLGAGAGAGASERAHGSGEVQPTEVQPTEEVVPPQRVRFEHRWREGVRQVRSEAEPAVEPKEGLRAKAANDAPEGEGDVKEDAGASRLEEFFAPSFPGGPREEKRARERS